MSTRDVPRFQGSFNIASGLWPLIHMGSFEALTGAKTDKWLARTVSGLLITLGVEQLRGPVMPKAQQLPDALGLEPQQPW